MYQGFAPIGISALMAALAYGQVDLFQDSSLLSVELNEPIVYIPQGGTTTIWRFAKVQYRGEQSTEGFFNVNGKPSRLRITSSDPKLLHIGLVGEKNSVTGLVNNPRLGEVFSFAKPGSVAITVTVGRESRTLPIQIKEVPLKVFPYGTPSSQLIKTLGLPDQKRSVFVDWPESETIDSIFYNPEAGEAFMGEHWRYKAYPGLIVSIHSGKVHEIASHTEKVPKSPQQRKFVGDITTAKPEVAEDPLLRTWIDATGKHSVIAKFLGFRKGKVHLQKKDGKTLELSSTKLSKKDQKWLREEVRKLREQKKLKRK